MVPGAGLEPARPQGRGILSPLRLPVSPPGHLNLFKSAIQMPYPGSGVTLFALKKVNVLQTAAYFSTRGFHVIAVAFSDPSQYQRSLANL